MFKQLLVVRVPIVVHKASPVPGAGLVYECLGLILCDLPLP